MTTSRNTRIASLAAIAAAALLPAATACNGGHDQPANTAGTATIGANTAPPGYPGATPGYPAGPYGQQPGYPAGAPAGYPGQPQAGYPAQPQPGYPGQQQPGYPAQPQPGYPSPPGPSAPGASGASGSTPPGPLAPTDPSSLQGILQGLQGALTGQTMPGGAALGGDLTEAGLRAYALRVAPGMQPEGNELKQTLNEGQHAVEMITLQAGRCYTLVGFSAAPGGVEDIDLNLLAPPLYMTLAGQDLTHNNTPVIGASPHAMCPVIAFPLQYKLDVFARKGSGPVAVQLYSKAK